ncbi:hypothetical protein [uncultured Clostridium sp.]|uniref:hypothetical protein n=1 Tax=uncultured Clostridium sp. TaxID=59620 RepID=UPI0025FB1457|nr:hypothetical protein [uncultured Clostridium sp.]
MHFNCTLCTVNCALNKDMGMLKISESNMEFLMDMVKKFELDKKLREEGKTEGIVDGLLQSLEKLLYIKFSDTSCMDNIRKIEDENTLSSIFEDTARSSSIGEFKEKLKQRKLN